MDQLIVTYRPYDLALRKIDWPDVLSRDADVASDLPRPQAIECRDISVKTETIDVEVAVQDKGVTLFELPSLHTAAEALSSRWQPENSLPRDSSRELTRPPHNTIRDADTVTPDEPRYATVTVEAEVVKKESAFNEEDPAQSPNADGAEKGIESNSEAVFICSLLLPTGQRGLGLFVSREERCLESRMGKSLITPKNITKPLDATKTLPSDGGKRGAHIDSDAGRKFPPVAVRITLLDSTSISVTNGIQALDAPKPVLTRKAWLPMCGRNTHKLYTYKGAKAAAHREGEGHARSLATTVAQIASRAREGYDAVRKTEGWAYTAWIGMSPLLLYI